MVLRYLPRLGKAAVASCMFCLLAQAQEQAAGPGPAPIQAVSQTSAPVAVQPPLAAPEPARNRGALFKASAHGHTMYLFGTMHVRNPAYYPTEPRLLEAIRQAPALYVELAEEPGLMGSAMAVFSLFQNPIYKALPPAERERLGRMLKRLKVPESIGLRTSPHSLVFLLGSQSCPDPARTAITVDRYLADYARSYKVPVLGVEDPKVSLALLNSVPDDVGLDTVVQGLNELEKPGFCAEEKASIDGWLNADPNHFAGNQQKMESDTTLSGRYLYEQLLRGRDKPMAETLAAALARQDRVVAAIGAAHLFGKGSVVDLLRARGVSVEQIY